MSVDIIRVETKKQKMAFIKSQWKFYKDDKCFVPPIIQDRIKLLNIHKNPFYKHSHIQLFLAMDGDEITGRIAAIVNDNHNRTHKDRVGFFGFFECIDDQDTADALFEAAESWLKMRGMRNCRGPENPSQNDEAGLLIEGFDDPPRILMTYNPPYYMNLIQKAGYSEAKLLYAYELLQKDFRTEKLLRLQNIVREKEKLSIRSMNFRNKKAFAEDVRVLKEIYNAAWEPNWGFVKMTDEEFDFLAADLKTIADPSLVIIAEKEGKAVGFALALPDINQALIYNKKGSLAGALWQLISKKKKIDWSRVIVLGVIPEYQKNGIDAVLYWEVGDRTAKRGITRGEASWILDDNTMMNRGLTSTMNGRIYKKYMLYEKNIL